MVLVISFLTQFIFFPILLRGMNLLLQTNTTQLSYWEWDPPSLHPNCHHKISSINCNVKFKYPLLYEGLIWDYKKANIQLIHCTIEILIGRNYLRVKMFMVRYIYLIKLSSTYFINLFLIKSSKDARTKIHHVLMMKFDKPWIREMSYLNSLSIIWNYGVTMIDCNVSMLTR